MIEVLIIGSILTSYFNAVGIFIYSFSMFPAFSHQNITSSTEILVTDGENKDGCAVRFNVMRFSAYPK